MHKIIPLWSVPRSVSTGFERMMMARGDFKVFHEPYSYFFYAKEQAAAAVGMHVDPDHPLDFGAITDMIRAAAEAEPVFFKDMAYHAYRRSDKGFLSQFVNTFIIRDPALTLPSHYKLNPEFTLEESGYIEMYKFFKMEQEITGKVPAIVDAEDLIEDPFGVVEGYCEVAGIPFKPEALNWEQEFPPEWKSWEEWHLDAGKSTGFQKDMETFDFTVRDVPRLSEMYDLVWPFYEVLYQQRIRGNSTQDRKKLD
jgi:hypothetical protein